MSNGWNRISDPQTLCKKLSVGYLSLWDRVVVQTEEGNIRTYDALRALESGLQHYIREDRVDNESWEERIILDEEKRRKAVDTLNQFSDYNQSFIEYDGIRLDKK